MLRAAALSLAIVFAAGCSTADATPSASGDRANPDYTCKLSHTSKSVSSLKRLPSPVRAYVKAKVGPIADRGRFFNAGDVVSRPAPFNRFIRGGSIGNAYFLWYEHGGFAYWKQIVLLDNKGAVIAEPHGGGDLCAQTDALYAAKHQ